MKPGRGAQKGAEYERLQAKLLSLWASEGSDDSLLWRTGMSGGRHTIGAVKGVGFGDLQVLKPTAEAQRFISLFCIELKHYAEFELFKEWFNPKSNLRQWWHKLYAEARFNKVQPVLIAKPNLKPAMMFFDKKLLTSVCSAYALSNINMSVELKFDDHHLVGYVQTEFLAAVSLNDFKYLTRKPS